MAAIRTPGFIVQTMCPACARVLVEVPGDLCPACRLQQHHIRRGASVAGDQRRLRC